VGIYVEISHPADLPGVAGSLALLLFLFGAGSLAQLAGLALMGLALVLLILDVRLPTMVC